MVPGCHQTLQKALDGLEWTPVFSTTPEHGSVDGLNTCETVMAMMSVGYLSHKPQVLNASLAALLAALLAAHGYLAAILLNSSTSLMR